MFRKRIFFGLMFCLALFATACGDSDDSSHDGNGNPYDFEPILRDEVQNVIVPTYKNLADNAATLATLVDALAEKDDLKAAQQQWITTRVPWEQSEAFLFGPVADYGLDPALDSWPVDRVQLDQVLASRLELTPDSITENLGGGLKGFHTIEYLLFGVDGTRTLAELEDTDRMMEYLSAVTQALAIDADTLYKAWASGSEDEGYENFGEAFHLAGQEGGRYYSQLDAMQQLVNGCAEIANEVANGKIADPFDESDTELVESQFSYNSLQDFSDNIRSIENIYNGLDGGFCLSTYVTEKNADLDTRVRSEIQATIDAIQAISPDNDPPFRDAITDASLGDEIEAAQAACRKLEETFLGPVMSSLFD